MVALRGAALLSRGLSVLTHEYRPNVFWWELVEVARKLTLTGFLALFKPGTLLQLYLGVAFSLSFLVVQLYAAPYRLSMDNFLSTSSASLLTLTEALDLGGPVVATVPPGSRVTPSKEESEVESGACTHACSCRGGGQGWGTVPVNVCTV